MGTSALHHVDLWVRDLAASRATWGWLLERLGWAVDLDEPACASWRHPDGTYVFMQAALTTGDHVRTRPGVNHLALTLADRAALDAIREESPEHGWSELYGVSYPHAGGAQHVAWYAEDADGLEVEVVVG